MTDTHEVIPGERGKTPDAQTNRPALPIKHMVILVTGLSFLGFAFWSLSTPSKSELDYAETDVIRQSTQFEPARTEVLAETQTKPELVLPTPVTELANEPEVDELLEAARRAPIMAFGGGRGGEKASTAQASTNPANSGPGRYGEITESDSADGSRFEHALQPTVLQGAKAGHIGNRNFIVAMGTSIPCTLETALSSVQPGFTSCVISRDVLSDNGRVVVMEKGTQVTGEYRGGLRSGQNRLFVLWNRAKTPQGVIITLASPATDAVGRTGFDGSVNSHWWKRFGSGLLLSVVNDVTNYAGTQLQRTDIQAQSTTGGGRDAAAIAVEQSINIPPTLSKHQGSLVSIFIVRDLDFSNIYDLRIIEAPNLIYDRAVTGNFFPQSDVIKK